MSHYISETITDIRRNCAIIKNNDDGKTIKCLINSFPSPTPSPLPQHSILLL